MRFSVCFSSAAVFQLSLGCFHRLADRSSFNVSADCPGVSNPSDTPTAILDVQIFNGQDFDAPQTLLFSGDQITSVGGEPPSNAILVDGSQKFLIPGLIDGHVHPADCAALAELAGYGVTTAVNMNCQDYDACAALRSQSGVADFVSASFFAVGNGSQSSLFFGVPPDRTIGPDTDVAGRVDEAFDNGSDFFKIIAELNGPSQQQQNEIVALARNRGKFTATHATALEYYDQAIESRTHAIQHMASDGLLSTAQIDLMKTYGQSIVPTLQLYRFIFGNETLEELFGLGDAEYTTLEKNVAKLRSAGVPVVAGTDAFGELMGINLRFGSTLHCELQNLSQAGFENAEVIRAATSAAAELYRLSDRGSIAEGKRADIVLLNNNPLENLANSFDIDSVWVGGVSVKEISAGSLSDC